MTGPLPLRADWTALRCAAAGQALARILAAGGGEVTARRREGGAPCLLLTAEGGTRQLEAGAVKLLWRGVPLDGEAPDWPRAVDPDAARFFLTARPLSAPAELDFDLAARRDAGNPFYRTVYTLKRLRTLCSRPGAEGPAAPKLTEEGRALALAVGRFPAAVRRGAESCDPWPVNRCAVELAEEARRFLRGGAENLPLLRAAETALGNALALLGISVREM